AEPGAGSDACGACKSSLGGLLDKYDSNLPADVDPTAQTTCVLAAAPAECTILHTGADHDVGTAFGTGSEGGARGCCGAPLVSSKGIAPLAEPVELTANGRNAKLTCADGQPVCQ